MPLYLYSLASPQQIHSARDRLSHTTALLLLAQVFSIIAHPYLLATLANELLKVRSILSAVQLV